jgi:hypothetical protein
MLALDQQRKEREKVRSNERIDKGKGQAQLRNSQNALKPVEQLRGTNRSPLPSHPSHNLNIGVASNKAMHMQSSLASPLAVSPSTQPSSAGLAVAAFAPIVNKESRASRVNDAPPVASAPKKKWWYGFCLCGRDPA